MADIVVTCPECAKKFKPKTDVSGKKIKCPFCKQPFVVPAAKGSKPDPDKKGKPAPAKDAKDKAKPAAADAKANPTDPDDEDNPDPYGVKHVELVPRCPNCTQEMENEHATICLFCGYNTLTRQWGKTDKILGLTFERHLLYLLPAMGAATFMFFSIIFLLYYSTVSPYHVDKTLMAWTDHESMRMWTTVIFLLWVWGGGMYCFKKFIEKPKPDDIQLD